MQTEEERLAWLDTASYRELLTKWRHEPIGSPWFRGDFGRRIYQALDKKRKELSAEEATQISKEVGW